MYAFAYIEINFVLLHDNSNHYFNYLYFTTLTLIEVSIFYIPCCSSLDMTLMSSKYF